MNKFTVIIPVYNVEMYLEDCLNSVINQDYQNLEIICVNDGSTDSCATILKKYASIDNRIAVFEQKNKGLSATRNLGLQKATGKYCYFLDSDDMIKSNAISVMEYEMRTNHLDCLYFSGEVLDNETDKSTVEAESKIWLRKNEVNVTRGRDYFEKEFGDGFFSSPVQIQCYDTEFLKNNRMHFSDGYIHEDIAFTYEVALSAERVRAITNTLYIRRIRTNSITNSKLSYKNLEGRFMAFVNIIRINTMKQYEDCHIQGLMNSYLELAYKNVVNVYCCLDEKERKNVKFNDKYINNLYRHMSLMFKKIYYTKGYGEAPNPRNSLIIVGAGQIGLAALQYFGEHRVIAFADNDEKKVGTELWGKRIISVNDIVNEADSCDIVICTNWWCEICAQLECMGISEYYRFSRSSVYELETMLSNREVSYSSKLAIYGCGDEAKKIIKDFEQIRHYEIKYVIGRENEKGKEIQGYIVDTLEECLDKVDYIIIASRRYHMAIEARLINEGVEKGKIIDPYILRSYNPKGRLIVNNYTRENYESSNEDEYINKNLVREADFDAINSYVKEVEKMDRIPIFGHVEIETVNRCNGKCSFCPVSVNNDIRPLEIMTDDTFEKIISELEEMGYAGRIAPFSNNEPLIDTKIVERISYMRKHLPKARIHMFTNGTLLTLDKYISIIENLDELIIDNYNQSLEMIPTVKAVYDYCLEHPRLIDKTDIVLRRENEILSTRGGDAPNRHDLHVYKGVCCSLPYRQLIIRPSGKVSLCCNDPLGRCTLGDVNTQSLKEIWYGEEFNKVRENMIEGRDHYERCKYCDTFYLN